MLQVGKRVLVRMTETAVGWARAGSGSQNESPYLLSFSTRPGCDTRADWLCLRFGNRCQEASVRRADWTGCGARRG